ncbi:MAG: hypothetical protein KGI06_04120 [Candidatus Micrarchaeota archaeon]|nr:hypothetical protein [Candidatus Micrarchaeota archaeon]
MSTKGKERKEFAGTTKLLRSSEDIIRTSALGSELSEVELNKHLGVGNVTPRGAPTNLAWKGWNGEAHYHFVKAEYLTPFLTNIQQINNWNYVLFGIPRIAVERNKEEETVDPKIKEIVDNVKK